MTTTFRTGVPDTSVPLCVDGYGLATYVRMYEADIVDIYLGGGRTMTIPAATPWRPAFPPA